jgi:hypothetical protein
VAAAGEAGAGGAAAGPSSVAAAAAAADAAALAAVEHSTAGRVLGAIGNTLFFGGVAAASFFGYYTYRYEVPQIERMVEETEAKPENAFPGSSVRVRGLEGGV